MTVIRGAKLSQMTNHIGWEYPYLSHVNNNFHFDIFLPI